MPNTGWLTDEEMRAWLACIDLTTLLNDYLDRHLRRDAGMSHSTYRLLSRLSAAPDRALRMTELAEALRITRSRLSHALAKLEQAGWVSRQDDPVDKRGQVATLTDAGQAVLTAAAPGHVAAVRGAVFDHLTAAQVRQFRDVAEIIVRALTDDGELPWRRR
jgi:DNA-binding MarR family transcriptional regulator